MPFRRLLGMPPTRHVDPMPNTNTPNSLWKIACGPDCGFLIRSHTKDEVTATAVAHAKNTHGKTLTAADARGMLEPASLPKQVA